MERKQKTESNAWEVYQRTHPLVAFDDSTLLKDTPMFYCIPSKFIGPMKSTLPSDNFLVDSDYEVQEFTFKERDNFFHSSSSSALFCFKLVKTFIFASLT